MRDNRQWETKELNPQDPFNETTLPSLWESAWFLKTSIIGNYCISCPKGQFSTPVGQLMCLGQNIIMTLLRRLNDGGAPNHMECKPHPLANFPELTIA
jgi:hypothetical protein